MRTRAITAALLAAVALGVAACGEDGETASTPRPAATAEAPATTATTATATTTAPAGAAVGRISKDLGRKPEIPKPAGTPPTKLVVEDVVKGKGRAARAGDAVTVQYVGVSYSTGRQFDASWDNGQPFQFQLGAQTVIPGWDQGVPGMRIGGRRELVIPPDLAYGPQGQPPTIAPNETLVFVIDLLRVG